MRIALAKIPEHKGNIQPSSFYGLTISHTCYPFLPSRWVLLFVPGVAEQNKEAG